MTNNVRSLWCQETADEQRRIAHLNRWAARKQAERVSDDARRDQRRDRLRDAGTALWIAAVLLVLSAGAVVVGSYLAAFAAHAAANPNLIL